MPHDRPLVLWLGQHGKTATLRPLVAVGLVAGTPQRWDSQSGPGDASGVEGCFEQRNTTLTVGATRAKSTLRALVEVASEHHRTNLQTPVEDQEEQGKTDGSPLGGLVVDVNVLATMK